MSSLVIRDIIIGVGLLTFILYYTKQEKLWGYKQGVAKASMSLKQTSVQHKRIKQVEHLLYLMRKVHSTIGFEVSKSKQEDMRYRIARSRVHLPFISRDVTPEELMGIYKVVTLLSVAGSIITFACGSTVLCLVLLLGVACEKIHTEYMEWKILSENLAIEEAMPDLFILLYAKLKNGTSGKIRGILLDYSKSIENSSNQGMRYFVTDMIKNIDLYGDESLAVTKTREIYRSAMVINFFNLVIQSLKGVDNIDKLGDFKTELQQQKLQRMELLADKSILKCQRAIYGIYLILAQFVVLSWMSKAGGALFSQLSSLLG